MNIFINGKSYDIAKLSEQNLQKTLKIFLREKQHQGTFAVALNGDFIAKEHYQQTKLAANDSIDVLFPIYGG